MNMLHAEILVVLSPAIVCALLCCVANGPAFAIQMHQAGAASMARLRRFLGSQPHLQMASSLLANLAFVGPAIGALAGLSESEPMAYAAACVLALGCLYGLSELSRVSAEVSTTEAKAAHKKTAGTVRSIVRGELAVAKRQLVAELAQHTGPKRRRRPCRPAKGLNPGPGTTTLQRKRRNG